MCQFCTHVQRLQRKLENNSGVLRELTFELAEECTDIFGPYSYLKYSLLPRRAVRETILGPVTGTLRLRSTIFPTEILLIINQFLENDLLEKEEEFETIQRLLQRRRQALRGLDNLRVYDH